MDIYFLNKLPLLITLSRKIDFTATTDLPTHKARGIFKAFWRIYVFYLKCGSRITQFNANEEFAPVQKIIGEILSGTMVNLKIVNEHLTWIEIRIRVVK